jgi:hypothetical protein
MRKIILVVASAVALGAATMTTGALAQRGHGGGMGGGTHFGGRMGGGGRFGGGHFGGEPHFGGRSGRHEFEHRDFDRRFAFRRRFFGPGFGFVATGPYWWDNNWGDGCLSRWERTPSGWRQRLC